MFHLKRKHIVWLPLLIIQSDVLRGILRCCNCQIWCWCCCANKAAITEEDEKMGQWRTLWRVKPHKDRSTRLGKQETAHMLFFFFFLFDAMADLWCLHSSYICFHQMRVWCLLIKHIASEMFLGECWGSQLNPLLIQFSSPFPGQESGISLHAKGDLFLFVHVGLRYGSQNYCPPSAWQTRGEKNADTLNEPICVCAEIWTFAQFCAWVCLTRQGWGGDHAWIVALLSSIVLSQQWSVRRTRKHLSLLQHIVYKKKRMTTCCVSLFLQGYHEVIGLWLHSDWLLKMHFVLIVWHLIIWTSG